MGCLRVDSSVGAGVDGVTEVRVMAGRNSARVMVLSECVLFAAESDGIWRAIGGRRGAGGRSALVARREAGR